jgi:GTP-binding protein
MRIEFRTEENPFAGRRNELTPRQQRKRQRLTRNKRRSKR